jgi:uncharacterized membrane protein
MGAKSMAKSGVGKSTDHPLERLVFFSDAVFAIAITLLVIEIEIPHLDGNPARAADALVHLLPSFFGFALSFLVIGRFWIGHHNTFTMIDHYDGRLAWPNLLLLMLIALMPFATAFMSANLGQLVPTLFYNLVLLATACFSRWLIGIATGPRLLRAEADPAVIALLRSRGVGVILGALTAVAFTFVSPQFSQIALATIPLWQWLLNKRKLHPASIA